MLSDRGLLGITPRDIDLFKEGNVVQILQISASLKKQLW